MTVIGTDKGKIWDANDGRKVDGEVGATGEERDWDGKVCWRWGREELREWWAQ
jgi:hypothetical protein